MPIYEYECAKCGKRTSLLKLRASERVTARCCHCGAPQVNRLMSRFAIPRSEESRTEALADPANFGDVDENDPKSITRMMKRMGREMGDEFAGPEFDGTVEELEKTGDADADDEGGGDSGDDL